MEILRAEGIVLHATPFQDNDIILTIFTPTYGLIKLFVKAARKRKTLIPAVVEPFTHAEFLFTEGRGELGKFREASIIGLNLALRADLNCLGAASEILQAIYHSQLNGKEASKLFKLLLIYLKELPRAAFPYSLSRSFYLKLLRHEGLMDISSDLEISPSISLKEDEKEQFLILTGSRTIQTLSDMEISNELSQKIKNYFLQSMNS